MSTEIKQLVEQAGQMVEKAITSFGKIFMALRLDATTLRQNYQKILGPTKTKTSNTPLSVESVPKTSVAGSPNNTTDPSPSHTALRGMGQ